MSASKKLCDGCCGNFHYEIDLFDTCCSKMLCNECVVSFMEEQEDSRVYDAITGEE
tara:strand:- start:12 stop:179 length:168 start_codon:yes stop_codon:yes gene_type:complete